MNRNGSGDSILAKGIHQKNGYNFRGQEGVHNCCRQVFSPICICLVYRLCINNLGDVVFNPIRGHTR